MKRLVSVILLAILCLLIPLGVVLASYEYYIPIEVENTNTTALESFSVLATLNNDQLVDLGYIESSALDTELREGSTERSYSVSDSRLGFFIPSIAGTQTRTYNYRLGLDPAQSSFPVILGEGGYATISDDSSLELGVDFNLEFEGWIPNGKEGGPFVIATASSTEDSTTDTHTVDLPDGAQAGDLVIATWACYGDDAGNLGWSDSFVSLASDYSYGLWEAEARYKVLTGSEGSSITVTSTHNVVSAHQTYLIRQFVGTPEASSDSTVNPPDASSLSASYSLLEGANSLWITTFGGGYSSSITVTDYPSGYNGGFHAESSTGYASVASAWRLTASTTEDAGAFTVSASVSNVAWTFGVAGKPFTLLEKEDALRWYMDDDDLYVSLLEPSYYYYKESGYEEDWVVGYTLNNFYQSMESNHLLLEADYDSGNSECAYVTDSMIDLTDIDTLYIDWEQETDGEMYFVVDEVKDGAYSVYDARIGHAVGNPIARLTESLDVSGISGNRYLRVHSLADFSNADSGVKVYNVYAGYSDIDLEYLSVSSGEYKVELYVDSGTLKLDFDDSTEDSFSFGRYGFGDSDGDWLISIPYFNYYEHTVSSSLKAWYEPITMILSDTLTDRSGSANHADVTWGSNPDSIEVTVGGVLPYSAYVPPGEEDEDVPEVVPTPDEIDMDNTQGATGMGLPLYSRVKDGADAMGWSVPTMYTIWFIIIAVVLGMGGMVAMGSVWGFVAMFGATSAMLGSIQDSGGYNVMPLFITVFCVFFAIFVGYIWRYT